MQLTDGNANVIPSQSQSNLHSDEPAPKEGKTARNKAPKNAYDRIKLGKIRWKLPGRKDSTYADINTFQHSKNPTPDSRDSQLKRQSSHNYENPDILTLESYENIPSRSLSREGRKDSTYADINTFQHSKNPTPESRDSQLKRQSSHNYENPDTLTLQSYENISTESLSRELTTKPSVTADETVMVENTGVYESVDSNV